MSKSESLALSAVSRSFPPTRWSLVLAARDGSQKEAAAAVEAVCLMYWHPLYAYARRCGHGPHDAEDLTQEFFRSLLEKRWIEQADPEKGRLRSFLILAMKRFMAKEWRRVSTQKRGGGETHLPMDTAFAESYYCAEVCEQFQPEQVFDRQWALALLRLTTERFQNEFKAAGKSREFDALKGFLTAAHGQIDYKSAATALSTTESAARVAVHRFRKRFREVYRDEVSQTLPAQADVEAEVRYLADILARG